MTGRDPQVAPLTTGPATLQYEPAPQAPATPRDAASALFAGFLGWTLDAFDFFLVIMTLPHIAATYHTSDTTVTWAIFLTMAFRPVGALIFGLLADRYGRRLPMMIDLIFYSAVEVATGFAPNLTTFLILRALFGIGMGGEWGVGASLTMEKVPPRWRGILSGLLQEGYATGFLLASAAYGLVYPRLHDWRPLFFIGGLPALLALFVRFGVRESEVWKKSKAESWSHLGWGILSNWKLWLYLTALMTMMNFSSHGTQDLYRLFLLRARGLKPETTSVVIIIMQCGAIAGGVLFGLASDRFGRRAAMVTAFAGALAVIPLWAYAPSLALLTAGAFLMQFMVQGAWGIIPAHINELSPDPVRGFLPGFAYQCGAVISGTAGPIQSALAERHGYPTAMTVMGLIIFPVAALVTILGRERRGVWFGRG